MKGGDTVTSEVISKAEINNDEVIAFLAKILGPLIEEELRKEKDNDV